MELIDQEQQKLTEAMAAYRAKAATPEQLHLIEDALTTALRLFIAMGNGPDTLVPRGLRQALDGIRGALEGR